MHDNAGTRSPRSSSGGTLAAAGTLRHHRLAPRTGTPSRQRNTGGAWLRRPLIAFTDDDCRPDPGWLAALLEAATGAPGGVIQGTTRPDPLEAAVGLAPRVRTLDVTPPVRDCQTCNVLYPRAVLEATGGFDEELPAPAGEDTDLAERARAHGAVLRAAEHAVVFHAVEAYSVRGMAKVTWKWRHLPYVTKRHPTLRESAPLRIFWKHSHWRLLLALAGLLAAHRVGPARVLVLPYLRHALLIHGRRPDRVARALCELPSRTAMDLVEIAAVTRGSVRYRTLVL